jgi:hypothetical protein
MTHYRGLASEEKEVQKIYVKNLQKYKGSNHSVMNPEEIPETLYCELL